MEVKKDDRDFIKEYIRFGVNHNLQINEILSKALKKTKNVDERKMYYVDIHFNLIQLTEVFEMVIHAIKNFMNTKGKGFWGR